MGKRKLLIVEDDEAIRTQLTYALRDEYALFFAGDRAHAVALVEGVSPELVSLDLGLPPSPDTAEEGLKTLDEILRLAPLTKVMVVTGNGDRQNALRAVELGAFDFYLKPLNLDEFRVMLRRAGERESVEQVQQLSTLAVQIWNATPQLDRGGLTASELGRLGRVRPDR